MMFTKLCHPTRCLGPGDYNSVSPSEQAPSLFHHIEKQVQTSTQSYYVKSGTPSLQRVQGHSQSGSTPGPADSPCPVEEKVTVPLTSLCSPAACWKWKQAVHCCSDSFCFVIGNQTAGSQGSRSLSISPSMCLTPLPSVSSMSLSVCLFINLHLSSSLPSSLSVFSVFILLFFCFSQWVTFYVSFCSPSCFLALLPFLSSPFFCLYLKSTLLS